MTARTSSDDADRRRGEAERADVSAVLRLARETTSSPRGRLEPAGREPALEFDGWLELIAAVERLRGGAKDT